MHEEYFFIVQNALLLIKAKETIKWIKQNGYLQRWLIPVNRLQYGTPYYGRPVGNIPEFMPLENSLNHYILHYLCIHIVLS